MHCTLLILIAYQLAAAPPQEADEAAFSEKVAPIFQRRCLSCHNDENFASDLSLETRTGLEEAGVVVPGDPAASRLLQVITGQKGQRPKMPKDAEPLTEEEITTISDWIISGAVWPVGVQLKSVKASTADWWSLQPLMRAAVPNLKRTDAKWVRTPIDAFVLKKMFEKGLQPSRAAGRRTLIRRLYFDLIGLPPSPSELETLVQDNNPRAYENLVEKLLASPHYGERWARHWLDVVHYGDTHGYDKDKLRPNAWPYRDYVIRALNSDTPYGRFIKEQLAGDVLYQSEPQLIAATGFIVAGPWDFIGHVEIPTTKKDGRIARNLDRDDMVVNTMQTFCSVTVGCARCHNHKFDDITQEDYYSLQAVFAAVGRNDRPYNSDPQTAARRMTLINRKEQLQTEEKKLTQQIEQIVGKPLGDLKQEIKSAEKQLAEFQKNNKRSIRYGYHSQVSSDRDTIKWVQVDLGQSQQIDQVVIVGADEYGWADFGFPHRFKIEVSNDADFQEATVLDDRTRDDFSRPGALPIEISSTGVVARYVRITGTKLWNRRVKGQPLSNDWIFAIGELAVFSAGKNVAEKAVVTSLDSIEEPPRWARENLTDDVFGRFSGMSQKDDELFQAQHRIASLQGQREKMIMQIVPGELTNQLDDVRKKLQTTDQQISGLPSQQMVYAAATHFKPRNGHQPSHGKPLSIYVLKRGVIDDHLTLVSPKALRLPGSLTGRFELAPDHSEGDRRIALANWIADRSNPLTWRSIVNRMWQYHFGQAIVASPNDFGQMGQQPTHPELLNWLSAEFCHGGQWIQQPQSLKALHRLIVTSSVYRQATAHNDAYARIDGGNQYLWRFGRRRLEAESIRDTVLLVAGQLDRKMHGPGFHDFVLEQTSHSPHFMYDKHDPDDVSSHRRSVYRFLPRSQPQPFMQTLDCADPSQQVAKRDETVTALSALALLNNKFMVRMAEHFATHLETECQDRGEQIDRAFHLTLSRPPLADERSAIMAHADQYGLPSACRVIMNLNEFVFVD